MEQGYLDSTDHNSVELDGTVRREEPESLTHVWKDGEGRWNEVEDIRDGPSDTSSSLPPSVSPIQVQVLALIISYRIRPEGFIKPHGLSC
jgi:hypothetical protein